MRLIAATSGLVMFASLLRRIPFTLPRRAALLIQRCASAFPHTSPPCNMASSPPSQRAKTDHVTIGTHSGNFHCDEALACYMLKKLPE